jgi:diacylglycerol kinase family enzyme
MEFRPVSDQPIDLQIDGEYAGVAPVRIEIAEERVTLMLPGAFLKKMKAARG